MPAAPAPLLDLPAAGVEQVALATFGTDLVCTYANAAFAEVAGRAPALLAGADWASIFPGLPAAQHAVARAVAQGGAPLAEVDVTAADTRRPATAAAAAARRRWRLVLHRVEGVATPTGRVVSVLGTPATGPLVLDPQAFRQRLADTLRSGQGAPVLLMVDLGPEPDIGPGGRAGALRSAVRATDVVSLDVDERTGRAVLALLCPDLPAAWTAAAIGDRLRRAAHPVDGGAGEGPPPPVSVAVARPAESADALLRRAGASLQPDVDLRDALPLDAPPLRTTVRQHAVRSGRAVVVTLTGEADLSTLRGLVRLFEAIVADRPRGLVVDASRLAFCDVAAARALVTGTERAARAGATVGIAGTPAALERVLRLGWAGVHLQRWPDVEAALASL